MANLIPAGTYPARALPDSARWGVSSNGNEQIAIRFQISDGDHAGSSVLWIGNFAPGKGTEITLETLETAGVNLDAAEPAALEGLGSVDVSIVVEWRDREDGTPAAFVRYVNRPNRPVFKTELSDTGIASLSQRIKATRAASKAAGPAPKRGTAAPAPATDEHGVPLGPDGRPIF